MEGLRTGSDEEFLIMTAWEPPVNRLKGYAYRNPDPSRLCLQIPVPGLPTPGPYQRVQLGKPGHSEA